MSPARNRVVMSLLAVVMISALGLILWEPIAIVMVFAYLAATGLLVLLVVTTLIQYRIQLWRLQKRPALSDEEFIALSPRIGKVEKRAVRVARSLAARHLREFGGAWIRPTDRLDEDLHLFDMGPWIVEDFSYKLAETLEIDENQIERELNLCMITTFGELIQTLAEMANRAGVTAKVDDPLWDRELDV